MYTILVSQKTYGKEEIEMVSKVAFESNILKVSSIESMLKTKVISIIILNKQV